MRKNRGKSIEQDLDVVGVNFRMRQDARRALAANLRRRALQVDLLREPDNEYDENAVRVVVVEGPLDGHHLGYVGRVTAAVLAPRLDAGTVEVVSASLTELHGPEHKSGTIATVLRRLG